MIKTLFVINPISGLGKQKDLPDLIDRYLDKSRFSYDLCITEYAGHAKVIAHESKADYDLFVAVGGDGTINEIAGCLMNQQACLGVIPLGSGNGLGRHLQISTNPVKAILQLNQSHPIPFDAGLLNDKPFFNVSGTGFDAQISKKFADQVKRGYMTYARCVLEEIQLYIPKRYNIQIDDHIIEDTFFFIAFANTAQYGNNAFIAPEAQTDDGLLDVVLVKPFPITYFPAFAVLGLSKNLYRSSYVQAFQAREVTIQNLEHAPIHLDGEYEGSEDSILLSVKERVIKVMAPTH
jgi:YegS/Rv2252/BmrU family lipid kinase